MQLVTVRSIKAVYGVRNKQFVLIPSLAFFPLNTCSSPDISSWEQFRDMQLPCSSLGDRQLHLRVSLEASQLRDRKGLAEVHQ